MRLSLVPLALALAGLTACGPTQSVVTTPVTTTPTKNAPAWIDNESVPEGLGATGIAPPNPLGDKSMQRTIAIADAREKLAGKMSVRVQGMFAKLTEGVTTGQSDGKKTVTSDVMQRVTRNVTKQIVDQQLNGANTQAFWTDPSDNNLYVFVVVNKESLDRALSAATKKAIQNEIAQGDKSLESALDKLDAAIAASEPK
jgi:hypothetical protein